MTPTLWLLKNVAHFDGLHIRAGRNLVSMASLAVEQSVASSSARVVSYDSARARPDPIPISLRRRRLRRRREVLWRAAWLVDSGSVDEVVDARRGSRCHPSGVRGRHRAGGVLVQHRVRIR
jgi:hypothetical protein